MSEEEKAQWLEQLKRAGWDPVAPQWVQRGPVDLAQLPILQRQRELLRKIRELLALQLHSDQEALAAAAATVRLPPRAPPVDPQ